MRSKLNAQIIIALTFVLMTIYVSSTPIIGNTAAMQINMQATRRLVVQNLNSTIPPPQRPMLSIEKTINATLIQPYQWIHVTVLISNIGNGTAYNLTIIEPTLNNWVSNSLNWTEERYVIVDYNASIYYDYYLQPVLEGNFTIGATNITYYDINGTQYRSYSQRFSVLCVLPQQIPILEKQKWITMTDYLVTILGILLAIVIGDYAYVKIKQRKAKTKKKARAPQQPVSKKKAKKKAKKKKKKKK